VIHPTAEATAGARRVDVAFYIHRHVAPSSINAWIA